MHSRITALARGLAIVGGLVLSALIILTCISIAGRMGNGLLHDMVKADFLAGPAQALLDLGVGPILGDFELTEAGMAFAIFAFLPLCQINGAHAQVDVFVSRFSPRLNKGLHWIADLLFAFVTVLIAWQLYLGMLSKHSTGQTTYLLEFPVWWAYLASLGGAIVAALISIYIAVERTREVVTGRDILPPDLGAEH